MPELFPGYVATDAGQPCPDLVTSTIPAPLCQRHRMQIAIAVVPEMLRTAAGMDMRPPRELPLRERALVDSAGRASLKLDGSHASVVYFLVRGDQLKIGFSTNLRRRLEALHADGSDVALLLVGDRRLEAALHEHFADFRIQATEWFQRAPALENFVGAKRRLPVPSAGAPGAVALPYASSRLPVQVSPSTLLDMAASAMREGAGGVHLSDIIAAFRDAGVHAPWSLADLGRAYEQAGVRVRRALRSGGASASASTGTTSRP